MISGCTSKQAKFVKGISLGLRTTFAPNFEGLPRMAYKSTD